MASAEKQLPFLDFGNAPELFANGLQEIQVDGSMVRFTFHVTRVHNGERVRIAIFHVNLPISAVPEAWGMTARDVGPHVRLPEFGRRFFGRDKNGDGCPASC